MGARPGVLGAILTLLPSLVGVAGAGATLSVSGDAAAQSVDVRPWLGIAMEADAAAAGVRVGHVVRGSPAEKAGLREGDHILRVAATAVSRGAEVVRAVGSHAVGDPVEIAFVRDGKEQRATALLAAFPSQDDVMRMDLIGASAPAWRDLDVVSGSSPTALASLRGHVVLLDFWATWCAPCRVSIPKLGALQARYGAQGLKVVGISTEDAQSVALFAERMSVPYAIAVDKNAETTRSYGVVSMPTLVVIDKRGVVRDVAVGYDPSGDARLDATIRALVAEAGN
jgi:peroxiredoxin